jgi:hypothetical protein
MYDSAEYENIASDLRLRRVKEALGEALRLEFDVAAVCIPGRCRRHQNELAAEVDAYAVSKQD